MPVLLPGKIELLLVNQSHGNENSPIITEEVPERISEIPTKLSLDKGSVVIALGNQVRTIDLLVIDFKGKIL